MAKQISVLSAQQETGEVTDPTGQGRRRQSFTGNVRLNVELAWLKNRPVVDASMTPVEARAIAVQLLVAAERAEGHRVQV